MEDLLICTYQNTPKFSLENRILPAKCLDIYDGDTATFGVIINHELYKFNMRFSGIDTPEIRPRRSNPNRDSEKKAAKYVRNRVLQLISNQEVDLNKNYTRKQIKNILGNSRKIVYLKCGKFGKFGRCLIKIFLNEKGKKIFEEIFIEQKKRIYNALKNSDSDSVIKFKNVLSKIINE